MKLPKKIPKGVPTKTPLPRQPPAWARPSQPPPPAAQPARFTKPKARTGTPRYVVQSVSEGLPDYGTYTNAPPAPPGSELGQLSSDELKALQKQRRVDRWRQGAIWAGGMAAFGLGLYIVTMWVSINNVPSPENLPADLIDRFDKEAEGYDEKVNFAETMMFLSSKRKAMLEKARGHVLEVAVGTGRNFAYYPTKKCETVTLLDYSGPMLEVARRKWKDEQPEYFHRVFFKQQSALDPITPPFGAQDGYDTVIQTMGLCSTPEPVKLLQNLEATVKEDGQILLLEHGRSHYEWVDNLLDKTAPAHADEHGCWWNKDIGKIIEESGLQVVDIKRYNFGTTWAVELKPRPGMRKKLMEIKDEVLAEPAPSQNNGPSIWSRALSILWK